MYKKTELKITRQGGPIANTAYVMTEGKDVAAVLVDMESKRGEVLATGTDGEFPVIIIQGIEGSVHLTSGNEKESTEIVFPGFKGYDIWSANISRYNLRICFVKKEKC